MIKIGDYVTRNSYKNDMIFKFINIDSNTIYLKGVDYRLYAHANLNDLVLVDNKKYKDEFNPSL